MSDISLLSKDQVLALINEKNPGLNLTYEKVSFGEPVAASGETPVKDTELVLTGIPGKGFKNTATIQYNRIDLAQFEVQIPSQIQVEGDVTIQTILDGFNAFYGANLQLDDVRPDLTLPADLTSEPQDFTLIAAAGSYAYRSQVVISIQAADRDLNDAITTKVLDGLTLSLS
ncbi:hypothetical protein D3C76_25880 [compost metagenome]